jgi:uncharacterized membrane protein YdbT with pleckstrin-like domain
MAFREDDPADYEQLVVDVHPHWYGLAVAALRVPILLLLAVVGASYLSAWPDDETIQYTVIAVAVGLLVKYSLLPWLRWATTRYILTTERLVVSVGVVRRSVTDIPLSNIGEVESSSSLIEALFGCGTLAVSGRDGRGRFELPRMPKVVYVGSTLHRLAHDTGW